MKNRKQKLMLVILKMLGIIVCVLVTMIMIAVSALLYFENHDFTNRNGIDKKEFSCYRGELEIRGTVFMPSGLMRIGRRYATDVMDMDTLPTITRYTGKVLILHGDRDTLVNISGSQEAAEAYEAAGADVRFQIIPGGKHIFLNPEHIKMAVNTISEFAAQIMEKKS